jgi:signal transduction histidine kinase
MGTFTQYELAAGTVGWRALQWEKTTGRRDMTILKGAGAHRTWLTGKLTRACDPLITVCVYVVLYLFLDWISFIHALPGVSITLWNPPPACSLALLLTRGLRYAPALLFANIVSDGLVAGYPSGLATTFIADSVIAAGYSAVAMVLRSLSDTEHYFRNVKDVMWFLIVVALGVLAIAGLTTGVFVLMHTLTRSQFSLALGEFWIGDFTGIIGLLPAVMSVHWVRQHWSDVAPLQRLIDIMVFLVGLALALWMVFGIARYRELHFFYLLLLPVMWVAVRHGLPWGAVAVLITQIGLIATVVALNYPASEFLSFQILSLTISATGLLTGAVVSERQRAELALRLQQVELDRAARLTTAGALGMAVVHEISQPLATVAVYTHACRQLLLADPTNKDMLVETMTKAEAEVRRAGAVLERLRDFVSNGNRYLSPVDLGAVARDVVTTLTDDARRFGVHIRLHAPPMPVLMVDRVQIEQVLVNLIRNALDATAEGSGASKTVQIRLSDISDAVEVVVEDDGPGVSPDLAERLFEPFQTSKRGGMGLGLWLSRELVVAHGGRLWYDLDATMGARFVFRLPLVWRDAND